MTAIGTSATLLVAAGMGQTLGDLLVLAAVLGLVACGYQQGLFFAILMLFHALVAVVASLAFAEPLAGWLVAVDMPKAYAFAAAALLGAVIPAVGIRLAIGAAVPQDAVRFEPLVDKIGGGAIGAMAGVIVAGGVLILMSLAPLPDSLVIDSSKLRFDMGKRMLQSFVRFFWRESRGKRSTRTTWEGHATPSARSRPPTAHLNSHQPASGASLLRIVTATRPGIRESRFSTTMEMGCFPERFRRTI